MYDMYPIPILIGNRKAPQNDYVMPYLPYRLIITQESIIWVAIRYGHVYDLSFSVRDR